MRAAVAALLLGAAATLGSGVARADALIDDVNGVALDAGGQVTHFTGLLLTPDGKVAALLKDGDKRPSKLDWRADMHGAVLIPGFVDADAHVMRLGFRTLELDLSGAKSLDEAKARIVAWIAANPDRKWVLGGGWDATGWDHVPTAADLDAVAGGRPVALERADGDALWVDSAAMKEAGVTAATKAPAGGHIDGAIFVDAARTLIERAEPQPLARERDLAFVKAEERMLSHGITAADDIGTTLDDWLVFRRAADAGNLRMRIVGYADSIETANRTAGAGPSPWLYDDRLKLQGVAIDTDGALPGRGACLKTPYADAAKAGGDCFLSDDQLRNRMSRAAMDGFQLAVAATGDKATAQALSAVAALVPTYSGDRRWRIEGAEDIDPADLAQFGQNGIVASVQPLSTIVERQTIEARLGAGRLAGVGDWRSIVQAGATLALGSATPNDDLNPFHVWFAAVTRQDADEQPFGGWQPEQALTRDAAWRAYTAGSAYAAFADKRFGMLAPGMWADFLIVDHDPETASATGLRDTAVLQTWVGGQRMWSKDDGMDPAGGP